MSALHKQISHLAIFFSARSASPRDHFPLSSPIPLPPWFSPLSLQSALKFLPYLSKMYHKTPHMPPPRDAENQKPVLPVLYAFRKTPAYYTRTGMCERIFLRGIGNKRKEACICRSQQRRRSVSARQSQRCRHPAQRCANRHPASRQLRPPWRTRCANRHCRLSPCSNTSEALRCYMPCLGSAAVRYCITGG